jgi:RNA polymerase sigma-70 factor (ECF subfamily)
LERTEKNIHQDLIEKCRLNDQNAQFELYKLYYKQMYNTSYRILNNATEAEDIMQDSFLDAFRKIDNFSGEGSFGGWLRRIVVNNSIDALKRRKNMISLDESEMELESGETNEPDSWSNEVNYQVQEIKNAISLLPDDARAIISLFLLEGYDHEEISQILDISYSASRTRYSRAKSKLQEMLVEQRRIKTFKPN